MDSTRINPVETALLRDKFLWVFDANYLRYSWKKIVLSGFLTGILIFFFVHLIEIYSTKSMLDKFALDIYSKVKIIDFQLKKTLRDLDATENAFCSDKDFITMREKLDMFPYLGDVGRILNDKIICTVRNGVLSQPAELQGTAIRSSHDLKHWNNQDNLFVARKNHPVITFGSTAAFISPAFMTDLGEFKANPDFSGGYVYLKGTDYIFKVFGKLESEHIQDVQNHHYSFLDLLPLSHSKVRTKFCDDYTDMCLMTVVSGRGVFNYSVYSFVFLIISCLVLGFAATFIVFALRGGPYAFVRKLRRAINSDQIFPVYQPKIKLQSGQVSGVEALARWNDKVMGFISPDIFISVAERSHLINSLTRHFITRVWSEMSPLLDHDPEFTVSINISSEDLAAPGFLLFLESEASKYSFNNEQIILEITERTVSNSEVLSETSARLKEQGFRISLDDFGTGFSNLAWLTTFEPDEIKIDKMFTQAVDTETVNNITLNGMFSMIDHLDVDVVFEGIETESQLSFIQERVPEATGQGWFFYRPMPLDDIEKLISNRR